MSKAEEYSKKIKDLENKTLSELGNIENFFGKKYKGWKIKDIYKENPNYVDWVKAVENKSYIGNDYYFNIEYSKKAIVLYSDIMDYMKNSGRN